VIPSAAVMARAILIMMLLAPAVDAAWITYRNNTQGPVVLQEVQTVNGKPVKGKPIKLAAGETFREFQANAITKKIEVLQPGVNGNLLASGSVTVKDKDVQLDIVKTNGTVALTAAKK
jgi:hypothetical protein